MAISDILIPTKTITAGSASFEVRGLSVNDLMLVATEYGPMMSLAFDRLKAGDVEGESIKELIISLCKEFPDMAAALVCLAADEFDNDTIAKMKKVALPITVEALEAIFGLTFASEAELKKFIESLTRGLSLVSGTLDQTTTPQPSLNGIGASAAA